MMKPVIRMTMGLGIMVLAAQQLFAQPQNCAPRQEVVQRLSETFGETRRGIGIARQGAVMEVFASDETGSWTINVTLPDGLMCLVASGQSYETVAEALPASGIDI